MPWDIRRQANGKYKLYDLHKKAYAKATFNSRKTAISQGKNYARYRGEKLVLKGNKLIKVKK